MHYYLECWWFNRTNRSNNSTGCPNKTTPWVYYHRKSFSKSVKIIKFSNYIWKWLGWKLQNHHQSFDVTLCMRQWLSSSSKVGKIVEPWSKFSNLKIFMWNSKVIMHIFWPKSLIEILPEKKGLNFIAELNRNFLFCPNWIWYKTMANYSFPTIKMSLETEKKMTWPWTPIGSGSSLVSN